ncbi:GerAB/ArcD/ProY family transporter [Paenibacillus rhizovicinus]|uniref:GerAB/ArcD/ProY family transporter n=1 Tax=Paenibacillus rhizovicinus TaxID=2704463 RepID=A0A6C0NZF1_9BACL|nr:GerAB/ArcD/ProY family transporter [Paenibacillus rhizovicinus]QHW29852.1 GerAB/ArcD/ProY family transporter [Paenibacillus rhizovicinus]
MKSITQFQMYTMFTQFLFSTAIGFFIGPIVRMAGFMSWISVILGCAIGLLFGYFSYRLALRRPNEFLGIYGKDILGKWPHYIIVGFAILVNLYFAAFILRQLTDFIIQIYLPGTPSWAVASLFGICVARGTRSGAVIFFRSAQGLFLFSVISVFTFPLFTAAHVDSDKLIALVTDYQPHGIWEGSILAGALFGEMAFLIYLMPFFDNKEKTFRTLIWSGLTAVIVTIVNMIATLLLFGSDLTSNLTYPTLEMIRFMRAGSFLDNLDPMLIVFWLFSMLLKIGLFLLVGTMLIAHLFGLKDHKPFSYGMAGAMVFLSVFMFSTMADIERITNYSESSILILKSSLPALYCLVDWLRNRKGKLREF